MSTLRPLFLLLALFLAGPNVGPYAQDNDQSPDEADFRTTSVAARRQALTTLLATAQSLRDNGQQVAAARALNRAARFQVHLNELDNAIVTYRNSLALLETAPHFETQVDALNGLGKAYSYQSKCDDSTEHLTRAISLSDLHAYPAGKAEALLRLSECQNYDDHALALSSARQALDLWNSLGNKFGIADAHLAIGEYQMVLNFLDESQQSLERSLTLWRELNVSYKETETLNNLGFLEYRKGAWQSALSHYIEAQRRVDSEAEPYLMGQSAAGLAESFIESGLTDIGITKYQEAREQFRLSGDERSVIFAGWGIGKGQYINGDYQGAVTTLQAARADALRIKESIIVALCDDYLGRAYYSLTDGVVALKHFEAALAAYIKAGNAMEVPRTRALMAQVYELQGLLAKADEYYLASLESFRSLGDLINQSATLYKLGSLRLKQNRLDEAEEYLRQSIDVTEQVRGKSTSSDLTAAFSASVHERYETLIDCLMRKQKATQRQDLAARAFETSELGRARSLSELLHETATNQVPGLEESLAQQERSLRQSLFVNENARVALLGTKYQKADLEALETKRRELEEQYTQVLDTIRSRFPSYEQLVRPKGWTVSQIQEQVIADDETVLLEYSLGPEKSYVWAVTRQSIKSYELAAQDQIVVAAERVYNLISSTPGSNTPHELENASQALSQMILSPLTTELNRRRILVVADGVLNYIPFQILVQVGSNEPLVLNHEIVNAPSASILGQLQQEARHRRPVAKLLAAFGDPVFPANYAQAQIERDEQLVAIQDPASVRLRSALRNINLNDNRFDPSLLRPLLYAKRELATLREVAGESSLVATEFTASRANLLSTDLSEYAMLHFATHGFLDPTHPENSGLVLSTVNQQGQEQNGFIGLREIYELRAPVSLVVLSACQTALGKDVRGEGLLGITRGFMYAGASSVVASLWKVDDEATAELMKRFYTNMLERGLTPSAALREAQNSIRQEPHWRSPYYWAGFTLQGDYRQVIQVKAQRRWNSNAVVYSAVGLGGFLAIAFWWYLGRRARRGNGKNYSTVK